MPTNFVPSFIGDEWNKKRHLPSSVFRAQVDPNTMLWKDCLEPRSDIDFKNMNLSQDQFPKLRPIQTYIGSGIRIIEAKGVPVPHDKTTGKLLDNDIRGRYIRTTIMKKVAKKHVITGNAIESPAHFD